MGASGDPAFRQWCASRVSQTLLGGSATPATPTANVATAQPQQQQVDMVHMAKEIAKAAGSAVAGAMAAVEATRKSRPDPVEGSNVGKPYSRSQQAKIKGFCKETRLQNVSTIWGYFMTTKSSTDHRDEIVERMNTWAERHGIKLDRSIFLPLPTVEAIVKLELNPGGCVAEFESLDKGLTPMICRPMDARAVEVIRERERASRASSGNRTFDEEIRLNKSDPTTPPANYEELVSMFAGFTALVFVLFGDKNDLYVNLLAILYMLESDPVVLRRKRFSPALCAQATWALCEDVRNFFGKPVTMAQFASGIIKWPVSNIEDISTDLRHQQEFHRLGFPDGWRYIQGPPSRHQSTVGSLQQSQMYQQPPVSQVYPPNPIGTGGASVVSGMTLTTPLPPISGTNPFPSVVPTHSALIPTGINPDTHPFLSAVTTPYLNKRGNLALKKVVEAAGAQWDKFPTIPKYVKNKDGVCYNWICGYCSDKNCRRPHAKKGEVDDVFASGLINMLNPGFCQLINEEGSVGSKRRLAGADR